MILTIIIHWGLYNLNIHQAAPNEAPVVATRRRGVEIASLFGFYWD